MAYPNMPKSQIRWTLYLSPSPSPTPLLLSCQVSPTSLRMDDPFEGVGGTKPVQAPLRKNCNSGATSKPLAKAKAKKV